MANKKKPVQVPLPERVEQAMVKAIADNKEVSELPEFDHCTYVIETLEELRQFSPSPLLRAILVAIDEVPDVDKLAEGAWPIVVNEAIDYIILAKRMRLQELEEDDE